jgi:hypothetical protein
MNLVELNFLFKMKLDDQLLLIKLPKQCSNIYDIHGFGFFFVFIREHDRSCSKSHN